MIKVKNLNIFLLLAMGVGLAIPYPRRVREQEPTESDFDSVFAFVKDKGGAPIYKEPGSVLIDRLPFNTYVGVLTGNSSGQFLEVAIGVISGKTSTPYFFWIDKSGIEEKKGKVEAKSKLNQDGIRKSNVVVDKIIQANA